MFTRDPGNPILIPSDQWWEAKGVLNPAAYYSKGKVILIYRAVGSDGLSRFGRATSADGRNFERDAAPVYEAMHGDWDARLGIEDPRITALEDAQYVTFTKVSVESASHPRLSWETAPFRVRSWIARVVDGESTDSSQLQDPNASAIEAPRFDEIGPVLSDQNTKDLVLFPNKIGGQYAALIRQWPSVQVVTSPDLKRWGKPTTILQPRKNSWEGERIGAGPPPVRISTGWLLLYHANEYLRFPGNRRLYRMGLAILDGDDPSRVLYRHRDPIFEPEEPYEREGPVGWVVFGTALLDGGNHFDMYYGAGDGVIGLATVEKKALFALLPKDLRP